MMYWIKTIFILSCFYQKGDFESIKDHFQSSYFSDSISKETKFMIYDVNPGEGFNLRRDVFIRAANVVKSLRNDGLDWVLVLPPWIKMYHWKSNIKQNALPWTTFFDLKSLNLYVPAIDFIDFIDATGGSSIDQVIYLQTHPDQYKSGFKLLINEDECKKQPPYREISQERWIGRFWELEEVYAKKFSCYSVQGTADVIKEVLSKTTARSVLIDRFETVLHIEFGSYEFFAARRSTVYSLPLRLAADTFRKEFLNSNDIADQTPFNDNDWTKQIPIMGQAQGGPYVGVHMRRGDFARSRSDRIPTIQEVASAVREQLDNLALNSVYMSTDGTKEEVKEFQTYVGSDITVYQFEQTQQRIEKYFDGGIAIIDQWIAAHSRFFIGTCDSTFSFRINEDRDILGFHPDTTYNCVCGAQAAPDKCKAPSRSWVVKFS